MAEYIEREAALEIINSLNIASALYAGRKIINLPPADVAPVRHGRWEWCKDYDGDSILVCSECGRVCNEEDAPYCYCGCKMDLEG